MLKASDELLVECLFLGVPFAVAMLRLGSGCFVARYSLGLIAAPQLLSLPFGTTTHPYAILLCTYKRFC